MFAFSLGHVRSVLVLVVLGAVLLAGLALPVVTYAAPPTQDAGGADALAQAVSAFLDLLLAIIVGGGIAYLLQMSAQWRDWQSPLKPIVVLVITALLGGALSALKVIATAELFAQVPEWGRAFIGFIVVFFGSQLTYQKGFNTWLGAGGRARGVYASAPTGKE